MKALELGDIEDFPFIQPPSSQNVRDGYDTLLEIHALEGGGLRADLTNIGRQLARLPVDPRIGRMLIAADSERCMAETLVIAAALATQDPRERPMEKQAEAEAAHVIFPRRGLGLPRATETLARAAQAAEASFEQPVPQVVPGQVRLVHAVPRVARYTRAVA